MMSVWLIAQLALDSATGQAPIELDPPYQDAATGITFPNEIAGLVRGPVHDYDKAKRGLGIGIPYWGGNIIKADLYLYDLELKEIPDGAEAEVVVEQFQQAQDDILSLEMRGRYRSVQKLSEEVVALGAAPGAPRVRAAHFSFQTETDPHLSHLYLGGFAGKFLKIRFTYVSTEKELGDRVLPEFLAAVGKLIGDRRQQRPED